MTGRLVFKKINDMILVNDAPYDERVVTDFIELISSYVPSYQFLSESLGANLNLMSVVEVNHDFPRLVNEIINNSDLGLYEQVLNRPSEIIFGDDGFIHYYTMIPGFVKSVEPAVDDSLKLFLDGVLFDCGVGGEFVSHAFNNGVLEVTLKL